MKETYIPGLDPKTGRTVQETSFQTRDMLERLRDDFDKPLAVIFNNGNQQAGMEPLSQQVTDAFIDGEAHFCQGNILDMYMLFKMVLVCAFNRIIEHNLIDKELSKMVFSVAASEGIDTAVANVLLAMPFAPDSVMSGGKLVLDNERFKNLGVSDPATGEPAFKICPGFRTAQAIERQLVRAVGAIAQTYPDLLFDNTIPKTDSVGNACKAVIDQA